ncbi:hypothetical protein [Pseudomonas sivasensis]|uniref:hypothetical protein n=1 Tax=Pseudomonas sivasensis TaxID=1880678 RepID=UPI003BA3923E
MIPSRNDVVLSHHLPMNVNAPLTSVDQPQFNKPGLRTEGPVPSHDTARSEGDSLLAEIYGKALLRLTDVESQDREVMIENIPPNSTFGQWWAQLGRAMQSDDVKEWMRHIGVDSRTVKITPESGQVSFKVQRYITASPVTQTHSQEDKQWSGVSGPVVEAAKVIAAGNGLSTFSPPLSEHSNSAPLWLVKRFYREPEKSSVAERQDRAAQLAQDKSFAQLPAGLQEARSEEALTGQKKALGDKNTRRDAAFAFTHLAMLLKRGDLPSELILDHLQKNNVQIAPDSSYPEAAMNTWGEATLEHYLQANGWDIPTNHQEAENLAAALLRLEPQHPPHGNYGGALAWPIPLDTRSQWQLRANLRHGKIGDIDLKPFKSVLEYLAQDATFEPSELRHPQRVLDRLIQSPRGQALGEALQSSFDAKSVKGSPNDWLLAALSIDRKVQPGASRGYVAGISTLGPNVYGKPVAGIVKDLSDYLVSSGQASSPEKAALQAHLLLASRTPELLVKDIPESLTFGSHSWVSFVTAVGRLEAKAAGSTAAMTYGEVMLQAAIAPISEEERRTEFLVQQEALKDWGHANGLPYPQNETQMNEVRNAFHARIAELKTASDAQRAPMPIARDMAREQLQKALPHMAAALFDEKCITLEPSVADFPGPYSVLDLYMDGRSAHGAPTAQPDAFYRALFTDGSPYSPSRFVSSASGVNISEVLKTIKQLPHLSSAFKSAFSAYCSGMEKSLGTQVKHLISQQPISTRNNLELGKLTLVKEQYIDYSPFSLMPKIRERDDHNLLVKTERMGQIHTYEIDLKHAKITERTDLGDFRPGRFPTGHTHPDRKLVQVIPDTPSASGLTDEKSGATATPDSFNSERTSYIADAFIKHINIKALTMEAQQQTTFDTEEPFHKKVREFMLNLIPLRSAIFNFQNGDYAEGVLDLTLDVFGFIVGAGAAAKGAKAMMSGASALSKLLHGAKIVGRTAIGSLNPFDGATDLAKGAFYLAKTGSTSVLKGFRTLTHSAGSYDLVSASKRFDAASVGTFKVNNEFIEAPATLLDGKWHAFNPATGQPYGPAIKDFLPSVHSNDLGSFATATDPAKRISGAVVGDWKKSVRTHREGPDKEAFDRGYIYGDPRKINGYSNKMSLADLMKLGASKTLTSEQVGMLVKKYDDMAYQFGKNTSARFIGNIEPRFGDVTPMPQIIYLTQTGQLSDGQCAALARAMATAMAQGKEQVLIKNMYTAAAFALDPASRDFVAKLSKIQSKTGGQSAFHAGQPTRQVSIQDMVRELSNSTVSKSLMIDSPGHAMAAGVKVDGAYKTYYFYDPNHGLANFSNAEAMQKGLEKLTRDKKLQPPYKTHSTDPTKLEFKVFDHTDDWQQKNSVFNLDVNSLYSAPLTPSGPQKLSNTQLRQNLEILHKAPGNQGLVCYEASMRVGQAEKSLSSEVYDAVIKATDRSGGTNYSPHYLDLMGIKTDNLQTVFNSADITESGLLNFKHTNEGEAFAHTVYIQKTKDNQLYLFNTNSPDLDMAMIKNGNLPVISGGMTVYPLSNDKGLQAFLNGIDGKRGWQFAYTPASTLNANVQRLKR